MGKKTESKGTTSTTTDVNSVALIGTVTRANQYEKMCRFTLDCVTITEKGNEAHAYVPVLWFNGDLDESVDKGERVSVTGSIRTGSYTNKDGNKAYTVEVVAEKVIFE
jgi:single-stranded DNA-binding protein